MLNLILMILHSIGTLIFCTKSYATIFSATILWIVGSAIILIFCGLLSMHLGKNVKPVLKKKERYWVRYRDQNITEVVKANSSALVINNSAFAETLFDTEELCPYVIFEYYNVSGWYWFLFLFMEDAGPDMVKKILYLPSEDEA